MPPQRSWVEISRGRLAENFRRVRALVGAGVEVLPVVKAEAYGHGAVETARLLVAEGARWVAVSNLEEGLKLREAGLRGRILVMADYMSCGRAALVESGLTPVIHSLHDLKELSRTARAADRSLPYHLKIESGMGRLGLRPYAAEILAAIGEAHNLELEGLMTHFASAADYTSTQTEDQIAVFENVLGKLQQAGVLPSYVHLSSSNAIAHGRRPRFENAVRPGLAIYGYVTPAHGQAQLPLLRVMPALSWKAAVLVNDLELGKHLGLRARRANHFMNGPLHCTLLRIDVNERAAVPLPKRQVTAPVRDRMALMEESLAGPQDDGTQGAGAQALDAGEAHLGITGEDLLLDSGDMFQTSSSNVARETGRPAFRIMMSRIAYSRGVSSIRRPFRSTRRSSR